MNQINLFSNQRLPLGVLVIHGFMGHLDTVIGLKPHLEKAKLPHVFPILKGHGTRFQDLKGTTHHDWYNDAERALKQLCEEVEKVVVIGLSMGGLVTLELAMNHPDKIAGIVPVSTALKFTNPLVSLSPLISKIVPYWPAPRFFKDPELNKKCKNYRWFATDAFNSLYQYSQTIASRLKEVRVPALIIHSKKDPTIKSESAEKIYAEVQSSSKKLLWFEKCGHEMMQDIECEQVFAAIMKFIKSFVKTP